MLRRCFQGQPQQLDETFAKSLPGEPRTPVLDDPSFKGEPLSSLAPVRLLDLEGSWRVAQPEDQPLLQNLSQAIITPLTWLGQGSYGCVELCRVAIPDAPGSAEAAELDSGSVQQAAAAPSRPPTPGKQLSDPHLDTPSKHASLGTGAALVPAHVGDDCDASCPRGAEHPADSHTTAAGGVGAAGATPPRQGRLPFARLLVPELRSPRGERAHRSSAPTSNTSSQQLDPELEPTQCDTPVLPPGTSLTLASHVEDEHQHLPLLLSHSQQRWSQRQLNSQASSSRDQPGPSPRPAPSPTRSTSGARRPDQEGQGLLLTPRRQPPAAPSHSASSPCPTPGPSAFPISPCGHTPAKAPSPARQASAGPALGRPRSSSGSLAGGSTRQAGLHAQELVVAVKRVDFGDLLDLDGEQPAGQEAPGGGGRCSRARASGRNTAVRLSRMQAIELLQLSRCRDCPFIVRMFGRLEDDGRGQAAGGCGDSSSSLDPGAGARRRGVASCRIVMEWAEGGDLGSLIQALVTRREAASGAQAPAFQPKPPASSLRLLMSEASARYYTACLLEALGFLHGRGLIHRDVKPSNLLIASDGRAKLADLGLACHVDVRRGAAGGAVGRAGTPRYMAPEVWSYGKTAKVRTYGIPADLFGVGCVLYELLLGRPPTDHPDDYLAKRPTWRLRSHHLPPCCSAPLRDLLYHLLHPKPRRRLQSCDEVRAHPWFAGFDWQGLRTGSLRAPYVPCEHRPPPVVAAGVGLPAAVSAPRGTPGRYGSAASLASASMELRRSPRPAPAVAGPSREASIGGLPPRPPSTRAGISPYRRASGLADGRVPSDTSGLCLKQAAAVAKLRRASPGHGGGAPLNGDAAAAVLLGKASGVAGPLLGSFDSASGAAVTSAPPSVASSLSAALASVLPMSLPWFHQGQQPPSPGPKQGLDPSAGEAASEESLAMQERALSEPLCFKQERPSAFAARSHGFNSAAGSCQSTLLASHDEDTGRLGKLGAAAAAAQPSGGSGGAPNSSTALPANPVEALVAAGRRSVQGMWSMLHGTASQPERGQDTRAGVPEGVDRDAGEHVAHSGTDQEELQGARGGDGVLPSSASAPTVGGTLSYLLQLLPVRPSLSASQEGWHGDGPQAQAAPAGVVVVSRVDGSGLHQAVGRSSKEAGKGSGQGVETASMGVSAVALAASHSTGPSPAPSPSVEAAGDAPDPPQEPSITRVGGLTGETGCAYEHEDTASGRAGTPCADAGSALPLSPPAAAAAPVYPDGTSQCDVPRRVAHRPTDSYAFDDRHLEALHRCPAWDSAMSNNSTSTALHAAQPFFTAASSPVASKPLPPRSPSSCERTPGPATRLGGTGEQIAAARRAGGHGRSPSSFSFDVPDALLCKDGSPAGFSICSASHATGAKSPFRPAAGLVARAVDRAAGGQQGRGSAAAWASGGRRGVGGACPGGEPGLGARCVAAPAGHVGFKNQHVLVLMLAVVLAGVLAAMYRA